MPYCFPTENIYQTRDTQQRIMQLAAQIKSRRLLLPLLSETVKMSVTIKSILFPVQNLLEIKLRKTIPANVFYL